jgi:hypothetical protein
MLIYIVKLYYRLDHNKYYGYIELLFDNIFDPPKKGQTVIYKILYIVYRKLRLHEALKTGG